MTQTTNHPPSTKPRARDLGIPFDGTPGLQNSITDVAGVTVGHATLIEGEGDLVVGRGPVRTGVTAVLPRGATFDPVFVAWYSLNGNGEMTGTTWVEESGFLEGPIALTNTHSVGVVRDALVAWQTEQGLYNAILPGLYWLNPVVAETYDGILNDINGFHVKPAHVYQALAAANNGPVTEGSVGGGTGMICHEFKGGIGSASRTLTAGGNSYTLGVLVQANHGRRADLTIAGAPVGHALAEIPRPITARTSLLGTGSIIVIVATDAPLLPHQLKRLVRRIPLGIGVVGGHGEHGSGDIFLAFATANKGAWRRSGTADLKMLANDLMTPLFEATVHATEEAIVNALVAAETMSGINGNTAHQLPHGRLQELLQRSGNSPEFTRET